MKYLAWGCEKYSPLTLAAGSMAACSVRVIPCFVRLEQGEQLELLAVIRARRIAVGRPDAAELLGNHVVERQLLLLAIAPVLARLGVEILGGRLRQAVGQRLDHDRVVVVQLLLELPRQRVGADAGGDGEHARDSPARRSRAAR